MKLQSKILKYLKPRAYVVNVIVAGENGGSDIICCYRGRFVAIESKDEGDVERRLQHVRLVFVAKHKGYGIFAHSVEDVVFLLEMIDEDIEKGVSK